MTYNINCLNCKNDFITISKNRKFCTHKCSTDYNANKPKIGSKINCKTCGKLFYKQPYQTTLKFCSRKCVVKEKHPGSKYLKCSNEFCNNMFWRSPNAIKNSLNNNFFCCLNCLNLYRSQLASEKRKYTRTKPEILFSDILNDLNIDYCTQFWVNWKRGWKKFYDFYLPKYDMLVEVDGVYWHGKGLSNEQLNEQQKQTRLNDVVKNDLAIREGFKLWRIWSDDISINNIKTYLNIL